MTQYVYCSVFFDLAFFLLGEQKSVLVRAVSSLAKRISQQFPFSGLLRSRFNCVCGKAEVAAAICVLKREDRGGIERRRSLTEI